MLKLTAAQKSTVCAIVDAHLPRQRVRVFGSRAGLTSTRPIKSFSDLDLLIFGSTLDNQMRSSLEEAFDESDLPFRVDIAEAARLSPAFLARIEAQAVELTD